MNEARQPAATAPAMPSRTRLRRILDEHPEARSRLGRAVAVLLGTVLLSLIALTVFLIWHLIRRGRLIRDRLEPPRPSRLEPLDGGSTPPTSTLPDTTTEPHTPPAP
jgi:hypothetical protein